MKIFLQRKFPDLQYRDQLRLGLSEPLDHSHVPQFNYRTEVTDHEESGRVT